MIPSLQALIDSRKPKEAATKPFPVEALIYLYVHHRGLHLNYNKGFKLLIDWLSPISFPSDEFIPESPRLLHTFNVQELTQLLNGSGELRPFSVIYDTEIPVRFKYVNIAPKTIWWILYGQSYKEHKLFFASESTFLPEKIPT